jgi:hypothetical protein
MKAGGTTRFSRERWHLAGVPQAKEFTGRMPALAERFATQNDFAGASQFLVEVAHASSVRVKEASGFPFQNTRSRRLCEPAGRMPALQSLLQKNKMRLILPCAQ